MPVADPYNLYFTPDGAHALVMAERLHRIDVRDPHTMALQRSLHVPCDGLNHADFSADQSFFVASCEFSGKLLVLDRDATRVRKVIDLNAMHTPGATTPMQAMHMHGARSRAAPGRQRHAPGRPPHPRRHAASWPPTCSATASGCIDARTLKVARFLPHRHGHPRHLPRPRPPPGSSWPTATPARITVLDASHPAGRCTPGRLPGGGSPDMGGVSADGRSCGSPAATTRRLRPRHHHRQARCTGSPSTADRTACACGPSPAVSASATPATCADASHPRLPATGSTPSPAPGARAVVGWAP